MEDFESLMNLERQVNEHKVSVMIKYSDTLKIVCTSKWIRAYEMECMKYKRIFKYENQFVYEEPMKPVLANVGKPLKPTDTKAHMFYYPSQIQGMDVEINDVQSVDFLVTKR